MNDGITLTSEMMLVLGLVGFTMVMFTVEWIRSDVLALLVLVTLGIAGIVPGDQLFDGFAGDAVVAIMAMMIMGAGLDRTGVLAQAASFILKLSNGDERRLLLILCAITGLVSAVMQNPAVTALFLPVVSRISTRTGVPISRLLLPMACCIILGGTMTMVGNSPQILLNDLLVAVNRNLPSGVDTMDPVGMFGVTPIGLTLLLIGLGYFYWFWPKLQPPAADEGLAVNPGTTEVYFQQMYGIEGEIIELRVQADSPLLGRSIGDLEKEPGMPLILAIKSGDESRLAPPADLVVTKDTILGVLGQVEAVQEWASTRDVRCLKGTPHFSAMFDAANAGVSEAVITPSSRFIGHTVGDLRLRKRFGVSMLALGRGGTIYREDVRSKTVRAGDILVLHGAWRDLTHAAEDKDFVVVTDYPKEEERPHRIRHAVVFFALSMAMALLTHLPLPVALLAGAVGMLLTGVINMDEAYRAINWKTIFLMASLIPLGSAMDATGAAAWVAQIVMAALGDVPIWILQLAVAILTTMFAQVMSNVGAAIVMVPMSVNIALAANADPVVFALIATISASNNFASAANPVMSLVAGPAGYSTRDLMRVGLPLSGVFIVVSVLMINLVF
jgi:di/tricarboxylate transporter